MYSTVITRIVLVLCATTQLLALAGCSLERPTYSPDLGGFPIYRGTHADRARLSQTVDVEQTKTPRQKKINNGSV